MSTNGNIGLTGNHKISVLLVDDQEIIAVAIRQMIEGQDDIELHYCQDPSKAIEVALRVKPTVILQDLVMPEIDGQTMVRFFRANTKTKDIPIVVLSSKEDATTKAESFANGANDYLVKLPDRLELIARIRYHSKGYVALMERNKAYQELEKELAEAASYVTSLLPAPLAGTPEAEWYFVPSTQLGGDFFGYNWIDENNFLVYLLDVCGHGVGAALLSVSVMNVLRSQSLPNTDFCNPSNILERLNNAFPMEENNDMFFTIWCGVFNKETRTLHYASGGHPPAVLFTGPDISTAKMILLESGGTIIGGIPDMKFENKSCVIEEMGNLFIYSDGAYEIRRKDGVMWTLEEWTDLLVTYAHRSDVKNLENIKQQVAEVQGSDQFDDDFSLLNIRF